MTRGKLPPCAVAVEAHAMPTVAASAANIVERFIVISLSSLSADSPNATFGGKSVGSLLVPAQVTGDRVSAQAYGLRELAKFYDRVDS
jgi:hypothetical protein